MSNPDIWKHGFGSRPKEVDDEYRSRIGGVPRKRVWSDERIQDFFDELLDFYKKVLIENDKIKKGDPWKLKQEIIRDLNTMVNRLLDFKQAYYPTIQKNININVDMTAEKVIERLREWKKKKLKEQGIVVENV